MKRRIRSPGYKLPIDGGSYLAVYLAGHNDVVRAQVRVHCDNGDVFDDDGNIVQAIADKVSDAIQKTLFIFVNALLLSEGDE